MVRIGLLVLCIVVLSSAAAYALDMKDIQLHGFIRNRFYANPDSSARFSTEEISLATKARINDTSEACVNVYYHPQESYALVDEQFSTYIESAYYDTELGSGRLRIGKGRQLNFGITPTYEARKTSQYGIVAETFTEDRVTGAQYYMKHDNFEGGLSLYNDLPVGFRGIGDFPGATRVVAHVTDRDIPSSSTGNLAVSAKIGQSQPQFSWHISYAKGKVTQEVADMLPKIWCPGVVFINNDRDHNKWGGDATYKNGAFFAGAEVYRGKFSCLVIDGVSAIVGYEPAGGDRAYIRYGELSMNKPENSDPTTWNTQQVILGYTHPIAPQVWAEFQYERNMERTPVGVPSIDNDLCFVEVFAGF